jgi:hypothetical protein
VAHKQEDAASEYRTHRAEYCAAFSATSDQKEACIEEKASAEDYLPWGYKLFGWPEGVTVWAIIATGFVIGWQAWETRKAAEATATQAAIQQEMLRPRLTISNFVTDAFEEARLGKRVFINIKITNSGGMPAYGVSVETWTEFIERGAEYEPFTFSADALHQTGISINVDTANPQGLMIPLNRSLTLEEICKMNKALGTICFRIRLEYLAFGQKVHTDQAFEMQPGKAHDILKYISAT